MTNREKRLEILLYNAITLLIDETFEKYDNEDIQIKWIDMMTRELGCTLSELKEFGRIGVDINGNLIF